MVMVIGGRYAVNLFTQASRWLRGSMAGWGDEPGHRYHPPHSAQKHAAFQQDRRRNRLVIVQNWARMIFIRDIGIWMFSPFLMPYKTPKLQLCLKRLSNECPLARLDAFSWSILKDAPRIFTSVNSADICLSTAVCSRCVSGETARQCFH